MIQPGRVLRDVVFAEHPGFRPVSLDLHPSQAEPAGAGAPVVLELHGGGWRAGSRGSFTPLVSESDSFGRITAAGFAVVAADYRLSGEATFPAQLTDVELALRWVAEHGDEHGLDPTRIVLWGGSAGGTLAALAALQRGSASVRGVIDWYGPSDIWQMAEYTKGKQPPGESREDLWLGGSVFELPERAQAASPVHHVHAGAPPFHLAHGADDTDVPPAQSQALADALRSVGVDVELAFEPAAGHFWRGASPERTAVLFDAAIAFATRVTDDGNQQ